MNYFRTIIQREMFHPVIVGIFTNPFYFARRGLYTNIDKLSKYITGAVLDIGCGSKPYKILFHVKKYIGLDIKQRGNDHTYSNVDVFYDGKKIPFKNRSFNSVVLFEVLEHISNPDELLTEISRVTKRGGKLLISAGFVWDEHEQPYDYVRYSSFGLTSLLKKHGFTVIKKIKSVNGIEVIFQMLNVYFYKTITRKGGLLEMVLLTGITSAITIVGIIFGAVLPKNNDFFLDNIMLATKK